MRTSAFDRLAEEQLYQLVVDEIKRDVKREGLWAKALVDAEGDREKAQAFYIKLRVQSLKDELEYSEHAQHEEANRKAEAAAEAKKIQEAERNKQKRRIHIAEAGLKKYGVRFRRSKSGWILTVKGSEISMDSINELESYLHKHEKAAMESQLQDDYLASQKKALKVRAYTVRRTSGSEDEWCLRRDNSSYQDHQIFNDFQELKQCIDNLIADEPVNYRGSGCQQAILLVALVFLILVFIALIT